MPPNARRRTRLRPRALILAVLLAATLLLADPGAHAAFWSSPRPLPEFSNQSPSAWINSPPLTREVLRGKVVLVEVFTAG